MNFKGLRFRTAAFTVTPYAVIFNKDYTKLYKPFIQLSLQKPWLYPRKELRGNNGSWVCGWLFFYFGIIKPKM